MSSWKRDAASGLVVLVPLLVTAYVLVFLFQTLSGIPVLRSAIDASRFGGNERIADLARVLLMLILFVLLVFTVGYLMRTALGTVVESLIDTVMNRVPGLRVVYNASKMAVETALTGTSDLQTPVKLEVWGDVRVTAFKTGRTTADGREVLFMPTAPNITTGFVIEVRPERITETDERVEEALTRILSAGFGEGENSGVSIAVEEERPGEDSTRT